MKTNTIPQKAVAAYFSPTNTSKTIALNIAKGTGLNIEEMDVTFNQESVHELTSTDLLIAAIPVYGGTAAPMALRRLDKIRGNNTPAVVTVVYGNRDFEHAATDLAEFLSARGFIVIASAAFVGEHSYSTAEKPIAAGRPDIDDRMEADQFGRDIMSKINIIGNLPTNATKMKAPASGILNMLGFIRFVLKYRKAQKKNPAALGVETNETLCTRCGICVNRCPVAAIKPGDELHTDKSKCIRCCACVKYCPNKARKFNTPFTAALNRYFHRQKQNVICLK